MRVGVPLVLVSLLLAAPAAAHTRGVFWPVAKMMRAVDDSRIRIGTRSLRIDIDTTLCSGEGRARLRQGVRTWKHFRCTFTTFTPRGPGRDVEFRVHTLDAQRIVITDARWIVG